MNKTIKNIIIGLICFIIGGSIGAGIAYHILKEIYEMRIKEYKIEIKQKQNIAKVYTDEYYKLANVLDKCKRCQTKYYE